MRIPALPQSKNLKTKSKESVWSLLRKVFVKRTERKRSFVRIPPRK